MINNTLSVTRTPQASSVHLQTRHWLLLGSLAAVAVCIVLILQAVNTYTAAYQSFQNIALASKTKIEDSDAALESIAQVSTDVVDSIITASMNPDKNGVVAINTDFDTFRGYLFKVNSNLEAGAESNAFFTAERAVYDEFWPHITAALAAQSHGDSATIIREYSAADDVLEKTVIPNLTDVEQYNFAAMQRTEFTGDDTITLQLGFLVVLTLGLALLLTVLSFWLRSRLRRYITPGLDAAMILAWLLALITFVDIGSAPDQLKSLVENSYYSVSATQRILAIASQANRTESAEILDSANAAKWQHLFDVNNSLIQQAICGYEDCVKVKFTTRRSDMIDPDVIKAATTATNPDKAEIVKVVPLVANVTYQHEAEQIESARAAYLSYLTIDAQIRNLVAHNQLLNATVLDTGDSDVAFQKFTDAIKAEMKINLDQFSNVWNPIQKALPYHEILFGVVGYVLVFGLLVVGVYHRYREL